MPEVVGPPIVGMNIASSAKWAIIWSISRVDIASRCARTTSSGVIANLLVPFTNVGSLMPGPMCRKRRHGPAAPDLPHCRRTNRACGAVQAALAVGGRCEFSVEAGTLIRTDKTQPIVAIIAE